MNNLPEKARITRESLLTLPSRGRIGRQCAAGKRISYYFPGSELEVRAATKGGPNMTSNFLPVSFKAVDKKIEQVFQWCEFG